jgi:hypothetical protein
MKKILLLILIATFMASIAFGQEPVIRKKSGPRRQLATIIFAGIGGAILGLSTLSFYGRPQDQLSNIAIGFAVGVISGTIYVTFKSATTRDFYDDQKKDGVGGPNTGALEYEIPEATTRLAWAPLIQKTPAPTSATATSFGGQLIYNF